MELFKAWFKVYLAEGALPRHERTYNFDEIITLKLMFARLGADFSTTSEFSKLLFENPFFRNRCEDASAPTDVYAFFQTPARSYHAHLGRVADGYPSLFPTLSPAEMSACELRATFEHNGEVVFACLIALFQSHGAFERARGPRFSRFDDSVQRILMFFLGDDSFSPIIPEVPGSQPTMPRLFLEIRYVFSLDLITAYLRNLGTVITETACADFVAGQPPDSFDEAKLRQLVKGYAHAKYPDNPMFA
jgi:hypothetical protein